MEENLLKELTPGIIASHFFVNVSSLSVLFKTVCQMTMMEYIRKQTAYPCGTGTVCVKYSRYRAAYKYGYENRRLSQKPFPDFTVFAQLCPGGDSRPPTVSCPSKSEWSFGAGGTGMT